MESASATFMYIRGIAYWLWPYTRGPQLHRGNYLTATTRLDEAIERIAPGFAYPPTGTCKDDSRIVTYRDRSPGPQ